MEDRKINTSAETKQAETKVASATPQPALEIVGGKSLSGEVQISGAKNSALAIMAGTLLCDDDCRLSNMPNLVDINTMGKVLTALGVKISKSGSLSAALKPLYKSCLNTL